MRRHVVTFAAALAAAASIAWANPTVNRSDRSIDVDLANGVKLSFAVHKNHLLGLRTATANGIALKSDQTLLRPYLVEEWREKNFSYDGFAITDATVAGNTITISGNLVSLNDGKGQSRFFVMDEKGEKPHLDFYRFNHIQLPSTIARVDKQTEIADALAAKSDAKPAGTFKWIITPVSHNVGGFTWQGWQHHYEFTLADGRKLNAVRELATFETDGTAVGNTLIAQRYRGLGGLAPTLEPLDPAKPDAGIKHAFTTTEIIPGAVDKAPMISPVVPNPQNIASRDESVKYRHGAWIAHMQRGGGANWIDFQYRPHIVVASFYTEMQAIRSLTEAWPGDTQISYTDNLLFPLSANIKTTPKTFITLAPKAPLPTHEWRTRYLELDGHVRDILCKDLNLVVSDPVPTLGINWDSAWEWQLNGAINNVEKWKAQGIKRVITHHPGWFNGRGLRQKETAFPIPQRMITDPKKPNETAKMANDTGGDCSIHDYVPQSPKVNDLWKNFSKKLNAADMDYWVWITGMVYGTGPVVEKFGEKRFAINSPDVDFSSGYPGSNGRAGHRGIPIRDAEIAKWWRERMDTSVRDLGVSGWWADSFQNMFVSQMNYQHEDWAPHVREWWLWIAEDSRRGVGFMAESHAFPALSCSIEVGDQANGYPGDEWLLHHSTRWYRGSKVPFPGTEKADQVFFRTMANKAPIAPGQDPSQIPNLKRLSDEYMAALPRMNRPYQLPDSSVLWLTFSDDKEGVLFPFADADLPEGVVAFKLSGGVNDVVNRPVEILRKVKAYQTYLVQGDDLLKAYNLQRGDQKDPRIGRTYAAPKRYMKDWSKE